MKTASVIGGGPAGLMAAEVLSQGGASVKVYDSMRSPGRKFLMAGKGGLNLTHSEPFENFISRYGGRREEVEPFLRAFTPDDLRKWAGELGIQTFTGSSGRIFPRELKASPLLRAWLGRLNESGVVIHTRHNWKGWAEGFLLFDTPEGEALIKTDAVVLALGGASRPELGSTGHWTSTLEAAGIGIEPFRPSNCGFDVNWSKHFRDQYNGHAVKSVILSFGDFRQQGEFVVTKTGIEGSLVYAASSRLRDSIDSTGAAMLHLDLAPDSTREKLVSALARPRGTRSMSSHIQRTTGIRGVKAGLLHEVLTKEDFTVPEKLAAAIKGLRLALIAARPIEEAISSAGGIKFEELDQNLMLKKLPGVFCAGEMLDWEAPTGGYLLTACFATGRSAGRGALKWLV